MIWSYCVSMYLIVCNGIWLWNIRVFYCQNYIHNSKTNNMRKKNFIFEWANSKEFQALKCVFFLKLHFKNYVEWLSKKKHEFIQKYRLVFFFPLSSGNVVNSDWVVYDSKTVQLFSVVHFIFTVRYIYVNHDIIKIAVFTFCLMNSNGVNVHTYLHIETDLYCYGVAHQNCIIILKLFLSLLVSRQISFFFIGDWMKIVVEKMKSACPWKKCIHVGTSQLLYYMPFWCVSVFDNFQLFEDKDLQIQQWT